MARSSRIRSVAAATLLVLGLAACGVEANSSYQDAADRGPTGSTKDGGTSTSTEPRGGPSVTLPGGSTIPGIDPGDFRQGLIDGFVGLGLTKDKATCMADAMIDAH